MRKATLLMLSTVVLALGGCALHLEKTPPRPSVSTRTIGVNVFDGVIKVPDDPAIVFAANGAVRWVFGSEPAGYVFPDDGIVFMPVAKDAQRPAAIGCTSYPDPAEVFRNCKPRAYGAEFQCEKVGKPARGACFKYNVKVVPIAGGKDITLDPWVMVE
ncbi:conserved exported hypothetical protein [Rubrivivax sp. A210]|uniref:hypothetical protein n=1 Tax=Rubrivivax sp. A210 TaxID=2772301 RepID=UPI001919702D|nr:hypothetical protein [Rubrivivax sp. A210]CAD5373467.1 conserved exported hypothetical protein [Rubrivivax sp. A210]